MPHLILIRSNMLGVDRQSSTLHSVSLGTDRQEHEHLLLPCQVRSLKAWKASVLQHQDTNHPAAGDCKHHRFHSVTDPNSAPQRVWSVHTSGVSPSLSTLVAINTSSPTDATANVGASTVCDVEREDGEEDEEDEE